MRKEKYKGEQTGKPTATLAKLARKWPGNGSKISNPKPLENH